MPSREDTPYREIPLTQGKVALVDEADYEPLSQFKWYAQRSERKSGVVVWHAVRKTLARNGPRLTLRMQNEIIRPPLGLLVDHIDGDGCNNRRWNLRTATNAENVSHKVHPQVRRVERFKGIRRSSRYRWAAWLQRPGAASPHLGTFPTPEDAARAYDDAALQLFGSFAVTNKILGLL